VIAISNTMIYYNVTFDPQVIFQDLGKDLSTLVTNEWVTVEGDATQAVHSV